MGVRFSLHITELAFLLILKKQQQQQLPPKNKHKSQQTEQKEKPQTKNPKPNTTSNKNWDFTFVQDDSFIPKSLYTITPPEGTKMCIHIPKHIVLENGLFL